VKEIGVVLMCHAFDSVNEGYFCCQQLLRQVAKKTMFNRFQPNASSKGKYHQTGGFMDRHVTFALA
jgi:hypothetical protein